MWRRNLLLIVVCLLGLTALAVSLSPAYSQRAPRVAIAATLTDADASVAVLNSAIAAQWNGPGIAPASRADDLTIARRLSLALAGTVPSLEEIRALEARPADSGRISWWLDKLFADRRSSDYLAERLARAFVGTEDGPFLVYRRRRFVSWLSDQLHANRPYDQVVRELITSTGLWTDHPATNFITVTVQPDQDRGPDANRLAARVARSMLGVRLDCAECHDHPFAPWKQTDFQSLAAFFAGTENTLRGIRDARPQSPTKVENGATGEWQEVAPSVPFAAELLPSEGTARQRLARWITDTGNVALSRATANRMWAVMFGRPLVEPIDSVPPTAEIPEPLRVLADDFVGHGYDLQRLISLIALSKAFQLDSRAAASIANDQSREVDAAERHWTQFPLTQLRPEQVVGSLLQAASLATIDHESHIVIRIARATGQSEFIQRYGDAGDEEFDPQPSTIPQRLLLMNGELVDEKTKDNLVGNAASQIAALAAGDEQAVEVAYLAVLTRRPTDQERAHFVARLDGSRGSVRRERLQDLYWALLNSAEFSWNH